MGYILIGCCRAAPLAFTLPAEVSQAWNYRNP